jgi:AraC-like DNA-binding protein
MEEKLKVHPHCDGFISRPGTMIWPHSHEELELNLVRQGTAAYLLEDRRYELRRHSLVWLFPAQSHFFLDRSADYDAWIVVFRPQLLQAACRMPPSQVLCQSSPEGHFCKQLGPEQARRLSELIEEAAAAGEEHDLLNAGLAYVLLSAWAAYRASDDLLASAGIHPAVEHALHSIQDETEPLTVEALARQTGVSSSYLSRLFAQQTGQSLTEFRTKTRLERLLRLLRRQPRLNLGEAALEAGFGSYAQFHHVFTERMGCSPAEYRRGFYRPDGHRYVAAPVIGKVHQRFTTETDRG